MNSYFNGIMVLLYMASHFLAEPVFVTATAFSSLFPVLVLFLLHFGGCGRVISCQRKTRRFLHGGVISGDARQIYYDTCIRRSPPALRISYQGFLAGEISARAFADRVTESMKDRRKFFLGIYCGISASLSLFVFLTFYFVSSLSETLLRVVITLFVALSNGTVLRFLLYGYASAARKSAVRLAEMLDTRLLRERKEPIRSIWEGEKGASQEDRLRALLREVERTAET